jgi:hypothetical protein
VGSHRAGPLRLLTRRRPPRRPKPAPVIPRSEIVLQASAFRHVANDEHDPRARSRRARAAARPCREVSAAPIRDGGQHGLRRRLAVCERVGDRRRSPFAQHPVAIPPVVEKPNRPVPNRRSGYGARHP